MKRNISLVFMSIALLVFSGCAPTSQGGKTYTPGQAQSAMKSYYGTVLHVSAVQIQHEESGGGTMIGAVLGGVVGSTIGSGRGTRLATVGGAAAGGAAGSVAERSRNLKPAWEIEVALNDGRVMTIVQEQDDQFAVGDHVRVVEARDGTLRVRQ